MKQDDDLILESWAAVETVRDKAQAEAALKALKRAKGVAEYNATLARVADDWWKALDPEVRAAWESRWAKVSKRNAHAAAARPDQNTIDLIRMTLDQAPELLPQLIGELAADFYQSTRSIQSSSARKGKKVARSSPYATEHNRWLNAIARAIAAHPDPQALTRLQKRRLIGDAIRDTGTKARPRAVSAWVRADQDSINRLFFDDAAGKAAT